MTRLQVFPYEYQRALKQLKEAEVVKEKVSSQPEAKVQDIEDTISDATIEKKKMEIVLDKTR